MTHRIELAPAAARGLRKLDAPARRRIQAALELLRGRRVAVLVDADDFDRLLERLEDLEDAQAAEAARREMSETGAESVPWDEVKAELGLAETPRPPAAKKLVAAGGSWRVRVGDYRILYDIHDDRLLILVLQAGHRREIYR